MAKNKTPVEAGKEEEEEQEEGEEEEEQEEAGDNSDNGEQDEGKEEEEEEGENSNSEEDEDMDKEEENKGEKSNEEDEEEGEEQVEGDDEDGEEEAVGEGEGDNTVGDEVAQQWGAMMPAVANFGGIFSSSKVKKAAPAASGNVKKKATFGSGRGVNKKNEDNLRSNCFYVAAGHLLEKTPKEMVQLFQHMMPSNNFSGEEVPMIKKLCDDSNVLHFSQSKPTVATAKYGIGYLRQENKDKERTGHCVVVEKGRYIDYQSHGPGENVRNDVEGAKSDIMFYFWELAINDEDMDMS